MRRRDILPLRLMEQEDCHQEMVARFLESGVTLDKEEELEKYLATILRNLRIDALRKQIKEGDEWLRGLRDALYVAPRDRELEADYAEERMKLLLKAARESGAMTKKTINLVSIALDNPGCSPEKLAELAGTTRANVDQIFCRLRKRVFGHLRRRETE